MINTQQPLRNLNRPAGVSDERGARHPGHDRRPQPPSWREPPRRLGAASPHRRPTSWPRGMPLSAPEAADLAGEPRVEPRLYGPDDPNPLKAAYARNCLLARRLLSAASAMCNLYCASRASAVDGLLNWDAHKTLKADYERHCPIFDQPTAALLSDLKPPRPPRRHARALDDRVGRMPTNQPGRSVATTTPTGFTCWMVGRGRQRRRQLRRHRRVRPPRRGGSTRSGTSTRLCSTCSGLDHERLTWYYNGGNRRLTDVHGRVIREVLARVEGSRLRTGSIMVCTANRRGPDRPSSRRPARRGPGRRPSAPRGW